MIDKIQLAKLFNGAVKTDAFSISAVGEKLSVEVGKAVLPDSSHNDGFPVHSLAYWFAWNWWRIFYEESTELAQDKQNCPTLDWEQSHRMTAVGQGCIWPDLTFIADRSRDEVVVICLSEGRAWRVKLNAFKAEVTRFIMETLLKEPDFTPLKDVWLKVLADEADPKRRAACVKQAEQHLDQGEAVAKARLDKLPAVTFGLAQSVCDVLLKTAQKVAVQMPRQSSVLLDEQFDGFHVCLRCDVALMEVSQGVSSAVRRTPLFFVEVELDGGVKFNADGPSLQGAVSEVRRAVWKEANRDLK